MGQFNVQMPDGSVRSVQGTTLSAAINNAGAGASAPSSSPSPSSGGGGSSAPAPAPASAPSGGGSSGAPVYQTVNGPKTVDQMYGELKAAGWPGPPAGTLGPGSIANAYQQTTRGAVTEMSGQNYGAAAQNQTQQQQTQQQQQGGLGTSIDQLLAALQSGNQAAAAEAAREFNATFGLDQQKFTEAVSEYNKNFGLQESAVTGTYNGAPTLAAQKQAADTAAQAAGLTGYLNGTPTLATRQLGLDALKTASTLQGDPFKQQEYLNGLSSGGYSNSIDALLGKTNTPAFQAPHGTPPGGTATLTDLGARAGAGTGSQAMFAGGSPTVTEQPGASAGSSSAFNPGSTADGASAASASGGSGDPVANAIQGFDNGQMNASLSALPAPNKIVGRNFLKEDPTTQAFDLSAESASTGLPMDTVKSIVSAGMPKFDAPTGMVDAT